MKSLIHGWVAVLACGFAIGWCGCSKDSSSSEADKLTKAFAVSDSKSAPPPVDTAVPAPTETAAPPAAPGQPAAPTVHFAPVPTQPLVKTATEAIKKQQYEVALTNLHALTKASNLSPDQRGAVQETMAELQQRLIRDMQAGDPKAKRAVEAMMKMMENP